MLLYEADRDQVHLEVAEVETLLIPLLLRLYRRADEASTKQANLPAGPERRDKHTYENEHIHFALVGSHNELQSDNHARKYRK
jgi:hypothetical protein